MKSIYVRKWTIFLVIACMMLSSFSFVSAAESAKSDVKGHWAESQLNQWVEKGLIKGYADGTVKPNNPVTRVELTALINRAFGFTEKAEINFSDMPPGNWAYEEAAIAVKAGYIKGKLGGTFGGGNQSSRQEVAAIIARLLNLQGDETTAKAYVDASSFASWSKAAIGAVSSKKIMQGYGDQTFRPQAPITRGELVVTLDRALKLKAVKDPTENQVDKNTYNAAGTYGPVSGTEAISGDVAVNVPGVTLQNMVISGNLLLAEGIGSGDAFLKNVTVKGTTTVQGGGEHSIHLDNSVFVKIIVDKKGGKVRLVVEGTTLIEQLINKSPVNLELGKDAKIVSLMVDALLKALGQGTIEKAIISDEGKGSAFEKQPVKQEGSGAPTPTSTSNNSGGDGNGSIPTSITVTSTPVIANIPVANGTSLVSVLGNLPSTVQITLSDGTTPTVNATWNGGTPAYNASIAGTYVFSGKLALPKGVTNPNNVQASVNVVVSKALPTQVSSTIVTGVVSSFSDINVAKGTSLKSVLLGLPTTVQITLSDGTNSTVNVAWDGGTPAYDGDKDGMYIFSGMPVLSSAVSNPSGVQAKINVIVSITVTNASAISDIPVAIGTSLSLPSTIKLTLSDGTTPTVNVTWDGGTPQYDGNKAGTYIFSGLPDLPGSVTNPSNVQAKVNVIVAAPVPTPVTVTNAFAIADIAVANGTSLLTAGLPTNVQLMLSDNSTPTVNVTWVSGAPEYDGNTAGTYTFSGILELPIGVTNPTNVHASVKVIVAQSLAEAALADINTNVKSAITNGLPATFTVQNLMDAGVTNINNAWITFYQFQVAVVRNAKGNTDLLLTELQDAIDKINTDATLVPTAAAFIPVNHFNNQSPGNNNLESGDLILLTFNVKLEKLSALAAIQAAVDGAFGSGNATVTTGNNITFNIIVNNNKNIPLPPQGALITLAANTVQNYMDGMIKNTAPISFTIEDSLNLTPQLSGADTADTQHIVLTFTGQLSGSNADLAAFSVSGIAPNPTIIGVVVNNQTVTLMLDTAMVSTDHIKISYTQQNNADDLQTAASVKVQNFVDADVSNHLMMAPSIAAINAAIDGLDGIVTLEKLQLASISNLNEDYASYYAYYYQALLKDEKDTIGDLTKDEIQAAVDFINDYLEPLILIYEAILAGDASATLNQLKAAQINNIVDSYADDYQEIFVHYLALTLSDPLSYAQLQDIVDNTASIMASISEINTAIDAGDANATVAAMDQSGMFANINMLYANGYQAALSDAKNLQQSSLKIAQIQQIIFDVNSIT
ncbi:Ig-like domain-containing protein [Cohnella silvisoli]|uniref:Ig-like domain-containing protein n=1 Tax=Cohnella silvisoli TaxID=2873699 RepID=A0ABV1KXC5_9BACL|nr:Ig-like domain-containing protein [Cohnella silvisoli]MCD9024084.1 Ig-like domain-containing protein [Cohnella silvisoli]